MNSKYKFSRFDLIFLLVLSGVGTGLILFSTAGFGAGMGPDSVGYLSMARNLVKGKWLIDFNAAQVNYQPPFYPVLLGIIYGITKVDPIYYLNGVNAVLYGVMIFLSGLILLRSLYTHQLCARIAVGWVATASPLYQVAIHAWTEPLFIVLTLLFLIAIQNYLDSPQKRTLLASAAAAALACLTRYAGGVEIMYGGLLVMFLSKKAWKGKLADTMLFCAVSSMPLILWLARNKILTGSLVGIEIRHATNLTFYANFYATVYTIESWLIPNRLIENHVALVFVAGGGAFLLLGGTIWLAVKNSLRLGGKIGEIIHQAAPFLLFCILYIGFYLYSATLAETSLIDDRFLAPVYLPILVLGITILLKFPGLINTVSARRYGSAVIAGCLLVGLAYPILEIGNYANKYRHKGIEFDSSYWRSSEIIAYLRNHPINAGTQLYTNGPDLFYLYFYNKRDGLPPSIFFSGIETMQKIGLRNGSSAQIIWFDGVHRVGNPNLQILQQFYKVNEIKSFPEGIIYFITSKTGG